MLDNPFSEEIFPNIQSKPPLVQLEAISSRPITCYLGEETNPHLATTSFQAVVESNKVSPQPPFLQTKQLQFPQPLLIRPVLLTLHQLRCPSLDALQHLSVFLVGRGPKLNTGFEGRPHQRRVQGDNQFPSPAGHTISDTSQDALGLPYLGRSFTENNGDLERSKYLAQGSCVVFHVCISIAYRTAVTLKCICHKQE